MSNFNEIVRVDDADIVGQDPNEPVSFDNPPQHIKPTQREYDALASKADMDMAQFLIIPENWDLMDINIHSSIPHYYQGNNVIPKTGMPKGSVTGYKCDIEGAIVLERVRIGMGSTIGDGVVFEDSVIDDHVELGDNVFLKNTELGNGVIAVCIEEMSGCKVGYNFDCHTINNMGKNNVFHRDMFVGSVSRMDKSNLVRTVSNDTEPLQLAEIMEDRHEHEHGFALNHV
jgi:NDP-sugar pyrophosphorylase family protein